MNMFDDIKVILDSYGPEARVKVDFTSGYISYAAENLDKALEAFAQDGIRLLVQRNIHDDGRIVAGKCFLNEAANASC